MDIDTEIERIELRAAHIRDNVIGLTKKIQNNKKEIKLLKLIDDISRTGIAIDEILSSTLAEGECDLFLTFEYDTRPEAASTISGVFYMRELLIDGIGMARSTETIFDVYEALEKSGINVLGQVCTDLNIRLFLSNNEPLEKLYEALSSLGIRKIEHEDRTRTKP